MKIGAGARATERKTAEIKEKYNSIKKIKRAEQSFKLDLSPIRAKALIGNKYNNLESSILAQDKRWRRA